jgi:glycine/D-amino acid oxidase-like deaminating enzyme
VARNRAQLARARAEVDGWRSWGFGEDHMRLLDAAQVADMVTMDKAVGGTLTPHCAALDPARLVRGLADAVAARGVEIHEQTPVTAIERSRVSTPHGTVRAEVVVQATEGYTPDLPGHHRDVVPMYSLMVATEALPEAFWVAAGLGGRTTFSDKRHLRIYGQRTADGRIAFGGRGAPYHYASRIRPEFDRDRRVHRMLRRILVDLFPALAGARFTHAWGGNLGIPRDWYPSLGYDRHSGRAYAGGYVGDGVATANLAGRTLADLITARTATCSTCPGWRDAHPGGSRSQCGGSA